MKLISKIALARYKSSVRLKLCCKGMVNKGHNDMENQRQFQQRIRQDAAERNDALQGLSTWMGTLKNAKPTQTEKPTQRSGPLLPPKSAGSKAGRRSGNFAQAKFIHADYLLLDLLIHSIGSLSTDASAW